MNIISFISSYKISDTITQSHGKGITKESYYIEQNEWDQTLFLVSK